MTTLSLEASKKVYEIVGEYETLDMEKVDGDVFPDKEWIPRPNFAELIRVLPKIGEKKGWPETHFCKGEISACSVTEDIACTYMLASTEPEGMKAVEEYLLNLL